MLLLCRIFVSFLVQHQMCLLSSCVPGNLLTEVEQLWLFIYLGHFLSTAPRCLNVLPQELLVKPAAESGSPIGSIVQEAAVDMLQCQVPLEAVVIPLLVAVLDDEEVAEEVIVVDLTEDGFAAYS